MPMRYMSYIYKIMRVSEIICYARKIICGAHKIIFSYIIFKVQSERDMNRICKVQVKILPRIQCIGFELMPFWIQGIGLEWIPSVIMLHLISHTYQHEPGKSVCDTHCSHIVWLSKNKNLHSWRYYWKTTTHTYELNKIFIFCKLHTKKKHT